MSLSTGALVGIIVGAVTGLVFLLVLGIYLYRRRKKNGYDNLPESGPTGTPRIDRSSREHWYTYNSS